VVQAQNLRRVLDGARAEPARFHHPARDDWPCRHATRVSGDCVDGWQRRNAPHPPAPAWGHSPCGEAASRATGRLLSNDRSVSDPVRVPTIELRN